MVPVGGLARRGRSQAGGKDIGGSGGVAAGEGKAGGEGVAGEGWSRAGGVTGALGGDAIEDRGICGVSG